MQIGRLPKPAFKLIDLRAAILRKTHRQPVDFEPGFGFCPDVHFIGVEQLKFFGQVACGHDFFCQLKTTFAFAKDLGDTKSTAPAFAPFAAPHSPDS